MLAPIRLSCLAGADLTRTELAVTLALVDRLAGYPGPGSAAVLAGGSDLARDLHCSREAAARALSSLVRKGLLVCPIRPGVGTPGYYALNPSLELPLPEHWHPASGPLNRRGEVAYPGLPPFVPVASGA